MRKEEDSYVQVDKIPAPIETSAGGYKVHLDGPIIQDEFMKMACLKMEETYGAGGGGPTIALVQKLQKFEDEIKYERFIREHGASELEKE